MSDDIRISTASVAAGADNLERINSRIRAEFSGVERKVRDKTQNWDGPAADAVLRVFGEIKEKHAEKRYEAMKQYVVYLKKIVNPGYVEAEKKNTDVADLFKE
jgi:hypothetical protein